MTGKVTPKLMPSKKKPDPNMCKGGAKHPTRNLQCWGNHDRFEEAHWATVVDPSSRTGVRKITWRD